MGPLRDHNEEAALRGEQQAIIDRRVAIDTLAEHAEMLETSDDPHRKLVERAFVQNTRARLVESQDFDRRNHPSMQDFQP